MLDCLYPLPGRSRSRCSLSSAPARLETGESESVTEVQTHNETVIYSIINRTPGALAHQEGFIVLLIYASAYIPCSNATHCTQLSNYEFAHVSKLFVLVLAHVVSDLRFIATEILAKSSE